MRVAHPYDAVARAGESVVQVDELRAAFEEKLSAVEMQLEGHEGPFLLG